MEISSICRYCGGKIIKSTTRALYHTTRYVNENLHRYTPKRELEAELRRKQARGGQKEGKV